MNAPIGVVLVGAGAIARMHFAAIAASDRVRLAAVIDPAFERAAELAASAGVQAYRDVSELPAGIDAHAAVVCTPPVTHEPLALALLARGLHVLCEKPFAISSESAQRMLSAATQAGLVITMASKFRYMADLVRARRLLGEGAIGEVVSLENTFASYVDMSGRWNAIPEISGGGVLIDNGTHSVDVIRYLLGPIDEVQASAPMQVQPLAVEDTVHVVVRTRSKAIGVVDLSWSLRKEIPTLVSLYGRLGTIEIGWRSSRIRVGETDWETFGDGYDKLAAFRAQHENFAAAIVGEEELLIGPTDALASVRVIESAYRALRADGWMPVEDALVSVRAGTAA